MSKMSKFASFSFGVLNGLAAGGSRLRQIESKNTALEKFSEAGSNYARHGWKEALDSVNEALGHVNEYIQAKEDEQRFDERARGFFNMKN